MAEILSRAGFDWRRFGLLVRAGLDGIALRPLAERIGVTATDLSRASSGTNVGIEKVFAICDWLEVDPHDFYLPPIKSTRCTSTHVKRSSVSRGAPVAAQPAAPTGPADGRSAYQEGTSP